MKTLIRAEAIVPFIISIPLITSLNLNVQWWLWIPIFLAPDLSMLGYLFGNKTGATTYNLFHHQTIAVIIAISGLLLNIPYLELAGLVLLGHSSLDRLMGYGLKLGKGFNYTHLGIMGGKEKLDKL
ncbi:DUF4260 domain-containing protein [Pedobacter sp. BMA]|uniref:DUF4260 domain-containing protein n=1 Tax=Pedobacter sp. BMA TaxID=1663685 RepID=UPI000649BF3A|nr:DUF4260 domain-containing protein [Pedobacter sp. BMA]KLT63937.1 hypothetical protein AB669_19615 [Pedobacter sp. BMA]